mmetsp:Transcript_23599/g.54944  ORF Transcript_23599/g.54944 Transcript_23599/m.54944 type:complete len:499 (+) Transcript_23599:51-1547(+)
MLSTASEMDPEANELETHVEYVVEDAPSPEREPVEVYSIGQKRWVKGEILECHKDGSVTVQYGDMRKCIPQAMVATSIRRKKGGRSQAPSNVTPAASTQSLLAGASMRARSVQHTGQIVQVYSRQQAKWCTAHIIEEVPGGKVVVQYGDFRKTVRREEVRPVNGEAWTSGVSGPPPHRQPSAAFMPPSRQQSPGVFASSMTTQVKPHSARREKQLELSLLDELVDKFLEDPRWATLRESIVRTSPGQYEINGRPIQLKWGGAGETVIVVDGPMQQPLADYVGMSESNATYQGLDKHMVQSDLHALPREMRMTFRGEDNDFSRLQAMQIAKEQAEFREKAAALQRQGQVVPNELVDKYNKNIDKKLGKMWRKERAPRLNMSPSPSHHPNKFDVAKNTRATINPALIPASAAHAQQQARLPIQGRVAPSLPPAAMPANPVPVSHSSGSSGSSGAAVTPMPTWLPVAGNHKNPDAGQKRLGFGVTAAAPAPAPAPAAILRA